MGAHNEATDLTVDTNKKETIQSVWNNYIEELYYQYGHDAYNGTFTTCSRLKIGSLPDDVDATDANAVYEYLWDNTEKWENALAVIVKEEKGIQTWLIGGWAAE